MASMAELTQKGGKSGVRAAYGSETAPRKTDQQFEKGQAVRYHPAHDHEHNAVSAFEVKGRGKGATEEPSKTNAAPTHNTSQVTRTSYSKTFLMWYDH